MKLKVFVVGRAVGYASWLENYSLVNTIEECDLVFFTGGEDVFPGLYGEPAHPRTYHGNIVADYGMPTRDWIEKHAYATALAHKKAMFGTCRGIQFLTVMNGGKLIQHVTNHSGMEHNLKWDDGEITDTTTIHHQMCYPFDLPKEDYRILAVSDGVKSTTYLDGYNNEVDMPCEPEVIYYPKTRCLGVQGHPEMYYKHHYTNLHTKLRKAIKTLLFENEKTSIPVA